MKISLETLQAVMGSLPDPVFVLTESGAYAGVFGGGDPGYYHDGSGLIGRSVYDVLPRDKAEVFMAEVARAINEQRMCTLEYGLSGDDVEGLDADAGPRGEIWFEGRIRPLPVLIDGERAVVWTASNITRRHQLEAELRRLSEVDELTGAYSRRKLMQALERAFAVYRRYGAAAAMLMLDIDHFKRINDAHGHIAGDQVLRETARLCMRQLRDLDLFCRFGGEEFVVLLPHTDLAEATATAERLRAVVAANVVKASGREICVTVSIGVSAMDETDSNFETVLKRIDSALYEAKQSGRDRCVIAGA